VRPVAAAAAHAKAAAFSGWWVLSLVQRLAPHHHAVTDKRLPT
jgi:hypothetical protein